MTLARKIKFWKQQRGMSLIELSVVIAVTGIVLLSLNLMFEVAFTIFQRAQTQDIVSMQIDPLKSIFQTQVSASHYALYNKLTDAEGTTTGLPVSGPLSNGTGANSTASNVALLCTLRSGTGSFILYWNPSPTVLGSGPSAGAPATPGVYLLLGTLPGKNTGGSWGPGEGIPVTYALSFYQVDTTSGFAEATVRIPSPLYEANSSGTFIYNRSTSTPGDNEIPYSFTAESAFQN